MNQHGDARSELNRTRSSGHLIVGALLIVMLGLAMPGFWMARRGAGLLGIVVFPALIFAGLGLLGRLWIVVRDYERRLSTSSRLAARYEVERQSLEAQVTHKAFHDPLTLLPNRALFLDRLQHALARAAREQSGLAVLLLDLDRFKAINDTLGHAAGDGLLQAVALRLQSCIRPADTVARLGGDEFAILLEHVIDVSDTAHVAERVIARLSAPFYLPEHEVFTNTSIGIVLSTSAVADPSILMQDGKAALYRAKEQGKGRYEVFDTSMNVQTHQRLHLEGDLRRAIERGEFIVHYQPTINLATGKIEALEALVRWMHPERGLVPPLDFIPVAEETGLIHPIGRWVLEEACRQAHAWHLEQPDAGPWLISVNLSAKQFQQTDLIDEVVAVLGRTGLEPRLLQLEITESVIMDDAPTTMITLRALKDLGVRLAIDDFGTGYSSLSYLKRFPVDTLKVDKVFVDGLEHDPDDTAIVQAVVTLARALGLKVTAEGIESAAQLAQLRKLGCHLGQGYYFARPLAIDAVAPLLAASATSCRSEAPRSSGATMLSLL